MVSDVDTLKNICVVIPAFNASSTIQKVIEGIPEFVGLIIIVDDCSSDETLQVVSNLQKRDHRIYLVSHDHNQGVGGAMITGYKSSQEYGAEIIVKMDSDDQMDPNYILALIVPIVTRKADYVKGNRFLHGRELMHMPLKRRIGNLGLSFLTKLASGYWNVFDPTNGYTAIRSSIIPILNLDRIDRRYFFESSMLIELGIARAVVKDINIPARYGDEKSSLSVIKSLIEFSFKLVIGLVRRIYILYFIRDFTAFSVFIISGLFLSIFGFVWGIWHWAANSRLGIVTPTGTVMLAVLPLIVGIQLILQAIVLDIQNVPTEIIDSPDMRVNR